MSTAFTIIRDILAAWGLLCALILGALFAWSYRHGRRRLAAMRADARRQAERGSTQSRKFGEG